MKHLLYILFCCLFAHIAIAQIPNSLDYPDTLWLYGKSADKNYGVTPQKPIKVGGGVFPKNNYTYLSNLTDENGKPVTYKRNGSCCSDIINRGKPLTSFTVKTASGKEFTLYFDQYEWEKPMLVKELGWTENRRGYLGELVNDSIFQGKGIYFFQDGGYYKGEWANGAMEGRGILYIPDTETYEGEFKNNQYNGQGILFYANGGRYEGAMKDDKRHGMGKLYYPPGSDIIYMEGTFENGKAVGKFTITYKKGKTKTKTF